MTKRHGRRHRQRGKKKFDVAVTTPVTKPAGAGSDSSLPSAPSVSDDSHGGGHN